MMQQWKIGAITITSVVEDEIHHIPVELFFPTVTADDVMRQEWLVPDYADGKGRIGQRVQAFVVEVHGRVVVVDPCVGNFKKRALPFWNEQEWPFFERFTDAGFDASVVETVVHTHLHADHVGWDTHLRDGGWQPTFTSARHCYTQRELEWCRAGGNPGIDGVYDDSIAPIFAAGLGVIVAEDADLDDGLRLEPTTGHTPGHVSLWIESRGEHALITGDFLHHPMQCEVPEWEENGDEDVEMARATRRRMLARAAENNALFLGTHFPTQPAGRVVANGDAFRFVPER